jgi:hypothetical protein
MPTKQSSSDAKRMVRNHHIFMILQIFHSPFFQLKCYFRGLRAIHDIAAHRPIFALPLTPLDRVHQLKAALQKER